MMYFRRLLARIGGLFRNIRIEDELEREIRAHVALLEEDFLRRGMNQEEAQLAARREIGGIEKTKQLHRDERSILWFEQLRQDLQFALRQLLKSPGFTIVAVVTFAVGIGANTAIFSLADLIIRRPVSLPDLDRLIAIDEQDASSGNTGISPANFSDLRGGTNDLEQMAAYEYWSAGVGGGEQAYGAVGVRVTTNFFATLGVNPDFGRDFTSNEDTEGHDREVILSNAFWRSYFAAAPSVIGEQLKLDGKLYTIVGVMPAKAIFPLGAPAFWTPLPISPQFRSERQELKLHAIGRLRASVSRNQVSGEIVAFWNSLLKNHPQANSGKSIHVVSLRDSIVLDYNRQFALLLVSVVGFVLLIACTNIAALQFARGSLRQEEIAIRAALGASRWRVLRQLMTESMLLVSLGGATGAILSIFGVEFLRNTLPEDVQWFCDPSSLKVDGLAFAFAAFLVFLCGMLSGLAPAWVSSKADPNGILASESHRTTGSSQSRWRSALVASEIALAMILLIGAALIVKGFKTLVNGQPGIEPATLLTFHLSIPESHSAQQVRAFQDSLLSRMAALPGVRAAGFASGIPYSFYEDTRTLVLEEPNGARQQATPSVMAESVSPYYFRTMHIPLRRGRPLNSSDGPDALRVAVVSESLAQRIWPGQQVIGRRLRFQGRDTEPGWLTVVGVVGDVQHEIYDPSFRSILYLPYQQEPPYSLDFVIRCDSPLRFAGSVRQVVRNLDSNLPIEKLQTLADLISSQASGLRYVALLVAASGIIALILSAIGVYALMANSVVERRREIGIRMALGAKRSHVLRTVMNRSLTATGVGLASGITLALAFARLLSSLLYGVNAWDPEIFTSIPILLAVVALVASLVPARRTTSIDPMQTLRTE